MNEIEILMLDDEPSSCGPAGHLYPEQRQELFESWWRKLSEKTKKKIAKLSK